MITHTTEVISATKKDLTWDDLNEQWCYEHVDLITYYLYEDNLHEIDMEKPFKLYLIETSVYNSKALAVQGESNE